MLLHVFHVSVVSDNTENACDKGHTVQTSLLGRLTTEMAKRTVVLHGIKKSTDRQVVEKLAGNLKRVRQLRYPVVMDDGDSELCAAVVYCGKRDAVKAVRRLNSQTHAGFMLSIYSLLLL